MNTVTTMLLAAAVLFPVASGFAQEQEPGIELGYPLRTRRPVIERELEFKVTHEKGHDGRVTEASGAVEFPLLPWWQVEVEMPAVFRDPREGSSTGGPGDVELQNKFLLLKSLEHRALAAAGFDVKLPSGSQRRGLGGEAAIEPFATAAIALGSFDLFASVAWEANINAHVTGVQEQELTTGVAAIYRWPRWFDPLLEATTVQLTRSEDHELRHRTQVYLIPGFNSRPLPGVTVRAGIELPVTSARSFDYTLHFGVVKEF